MSKSLFVLYLNSLYVSKFLILSSSGFHALAVNSLILLSYAIQLELNRFNTGALHILVFFNSVDIFFFSRPLISKISNMSFSPVF